MTSQTNTYLIRHSPGPHHAEPEIVEDHSKQAKEDFAEVFGGEGGQTLEGRVSEVIIDPVDPLREKEIKNANTSNFLKKFYLQNIKYAKSKIKYAAIPTAVASIITFFIARSIYDGNGQNMVPATIQNSERYETICRSILPEEFRNLNGSEAYTECSKRILGLSAFEKDIYNFIEANTENFDNCNINTQEVGLIEAFNSFIKCAGERGYLLNKPKQEIYTTDLPRPAVKPVQEPPEEELEEVTEPVPPTPIMEAAEDKREEEVLTKEELEARKFFESQ